MDAATKILKEMKTPKEKAKIKKWFDNYIEEKKVKNEKINSLMSNTSYLDWLSNFTKDKNRFCDNDWLYFPERINDTDKENVGNLSLFYLGIKKYANENYIYPIPCKFGNYYKIILNEVGFEIGILIGQGTVFFCKKVSIDNEQEFIDFNDIMVGNKQERVDQINASLEALSNMVLTTYESGVPIESIVETLENTIKEITSPKEDNSKSLVRK